MERNEAILLAGIIMASIWLGMCVLFEGKKQKYVIITGGIIDLVFIAYPGFKVSFGFLNWF